MIDCLKTALHELWAPSRYTMPLNQGQLVQARLTDRGAFTLQQEVPAAKSSPPPTLVNGIRVGVASPVGLEDLAATEDSPSVDDDEGFPGPGKKRARASSQSSRRSAVGDGDDGDETVAGSSDAGVDRDAKSPRTEKRAGGVGARASGDDDTTVASSAEGQPAKKRLSTIQQGRLVEEDDGGGGGSGERKKSGDGNSSSNSAVAAGRAAGQARGTTRQSRDRGPTKTTREEGGSATAQQDGGTAAKVVVSSAEGTPGSPMELADAASGSARGGAARASPPGGGSLAFDLPGILAGCRRASRSKRKRDERNASAYSFSGKLSGRASAEDQDSKAAARAFSRVLHKVGGAFFFPCYMCITKYQYVFCPCLDEMFGES